MRRRRLTVQTPPPRDGAEAWLALDSALKSRLRVALESERPVAESELRRHTEAARACSGMRGSQL